MEKMKTFFNPLLTNVTGVQRPRCVNMPARVEVIKRYRTHCNFNFRTKHGRSTNGLLRLYPNKIALNPNLSSVAHFRIAKVSRPAQRWARLLREELERRCEVFPLPRVDEQRF